ncbi:MAG: YigZ family protein [Crocinitomix sp.]|nr:YigZ family protein [Crocinitomix sp.]
MTSKTDAYITIDTISEGFYKEKGSKFLAFAIPCTNKVDAKRHIDGFRKEHHQACHVCFAWRFGAENYTDRYSDDGEPNNSAGKPIFGQILSFEVTNILIAVVRYYGGTNLGVGGLITAYKTAAKEALQQADLKTRYIVAHFTLQHDYQDTGNVMSVLNKIKAQITNQGFANNQPTISFNINRSDKEKVMTSFEPYPSVQIEHIKTT